MSINHHVLIDFIKESLLFETRMSNSSDYIQRIGLVINQITQKYVFDQEYLDAILAWINQGNMSGIYNIKVKDISSGQVVDIDYQLEGLFEKYLDLYERINEDAFGSKRQEQEVFYCKLGAALFFSLNQDGITKISYFNDSVKERETYNKFSSKVNPFIREDYVNDPDLLSYVEFIRKLLVRMSALTKEMLRNSVSSEDALQDYRIRFNSVDVAKINREIADYNLEFASRKMLNWRDRDIVLVKTKNYGNIAFYKRSGRGTGNNLFQGNNLKRLPFGGLCAEISDIDRAHSKTRRYRAQGATWLCKLPRRHPESDGTGKFLKLYEEFFYISLILSQGDGDFGLTRISSDYLIQSFFGKSRSELNSIRMNSPFSFDLDPNIDDLYAAFAINQGMHKKGALKQDWLPSTHAFVGSRIWGKNIGHNSLTFREAINNL